MKYLATISILVILLVGTYTHISAQTKLINPHAPSYFSTLMRLGENENDIAIYPNPSNGNFSLNITNAINTNYDLTIINSLGQTLLSRELIINESDFSTEINMENVTPGIYIVNLRNDLTNINYSIFITD